MIWLCVFSAVSACSAVRLLGTFERMSLTGEAAEDAEKQGEDAIGF
jgi:hypothetical protein